MKCSKCGRDIKNMSFEVNANRFYCFVKIKCRCGNYHIEELK